jgi:hypothetical protein
MSLHGPIVTCYFSLLDMFLKLWPQNSFVVVGITWFFGHVLETLSSKLHCYCSLFNSFGLLSVLEVTFQHSSCALCVLEIYVGHFNYSLCFLCSYVFVSTSLSFHLCSWSPCWPFLLLSMFLNCLYFVFHFDDPNHVSFWCWFQWWPYVFFIFSH